MNEKLQELKQRLSEVYDLQHASALLGWDQSTYMPSGGAPARGRQVALLGRLAHERFTDVAVGRLLDELDRELNGLPTDDDDVALLRVTRREYEQATKIPPQFLADYQSFLSDSFQTWTVARPADDFAQVQPYLERNLDYSRQLADFFPGYEHIADPLIDAADYGMKAESVRTLFAELRTTMVPLVEAITAHEPADDHFLYRNYPEKPQLQFGREMAALFGYDFDRGRLDLTHHPFMTKFSLGDVRITTRVDEQNLAWSLFSILHETGHALYEQGIDMAYEGTHLANGTSAGVHESQSRLWENIVGRSLGFWEYGFPNLCKAFPEQMNDVTLDAFYRAINKVSRSLIRTEADEVTYNLHIMIRFDLALDMLEGKLAVQDLPEAWHARYEADLGLHAPSDTDGCMQDIHWFAGPIGGSFQGYTLGNIMSSLFYAKALEAHPTIPEEIRAGQLGTLHEWLRNNIYVHGSKYTAPELIQHVVGHDLVIDPYVSYLKEKYGKLYALNGPS